MLMENGEEKNRKQDEMHCFIDSTYWTFNNFFNKWNTVEAFPLYDESQMSLFHRKVAKRCVICVTIHRRFQIQWNKEKRIYEIKWTTPTTHTHNYGLLKNIRAEKYRADIRDLILFLFSFFTSRRMHSAISTDGHSRHTHKKNRMQFVAGEKSKYTIWFSGHIYVRKLLSIHSVSFWLIHTFFGICVVARHYAFICVWMHAKMFICLSATHFPFLRIYSSQLD